MSEVSKIWDNWNKQKGPKYPHEKVIQFFFKNFPDEQSRKEVKVLDLGCGSGVHTHFLSKEGFKVSATDISEVGIRHTKERLETDNLSYDTIKVEPISQISFDENFFDVVLSIGVFDAAGIEETVKAIPLISRILKKGGIGFFIFASDRDYRLQNNSYGIYGYSEKEVRELFIESNLFQEVWIDSYITTYKNKLLEQNDFIVTVFR